ncbi:hypothetical protein B0T18DRAFT_389348 [Schizothecium vesticola]|uniref:DUF676 domain-containing protein n=1 Tax=Schizothecium vesticola TaxID=314040 RepID=A0AA40K8J9_9PEZI|nr:hypothetical protein B0T18DRAFT_389348 [Schizothecium vesticola]
MGTINKNIARFEITAVYRHPEAKADIVLVHGLNGNPVRSWTAKNGVYWPADLLPTSLKNEHANVLVYGYNADVVTNTRTASSPSDNFIHMHAQSLITSLTQYRRSEGTGKLPIVWVAHSLGGIVTKRALLYSNDVRAHHHEDFRSIFVSSYAIIFLGTPHNGSNLASWGRMVQYMSDVVIPRRFYETESILLKTLKKDNETLQSINNHFLDIYQRFRIHMVHENHTTDIKGAKVYVVDAASASPQLPGVTYYGIEATHSGMAKFDGENAPGYRNVSTAIREWIAESTSVIKLRWEVEEEDRRLRASLESYERIRAYNPPLPSGMQNQGLGSFQTQPRLIEEISESDTIEITLPTKPPAVASTHLSAAALARQAGHTSSQPLCLEGPPTRVNSFPRDSIRRNSVRYTDEPLFIHPERFRPNSFFIGREDELRGLHEMLMEGKRRSEGTSAVLIQCLPGGGKTHLARQYVFQHKDDYPGGIYWVRAKSKREMEYWYWRIAKNEALRGLVEHRDVEELRDPKRIVAIVRKWLNSQTGWLMVLDGVQFDTPGLHEFIPDARNTSLIYTSTERAVTGDPCFDNPQVMHLGQLTARQAQELLLLEMDKRPPWSQDDQAHALELVQLMGRLPLMIHVAAQHLKATREPLSRYLKSYRSRPKAGGLPAYRAVREQLEHRGENAALNLISILVFYDQHIPVEMISLGLSALDKITPIKSYDASHRKTNLNNTIMTLIKFALLERTESDEESPSSSRSSKKSLDKHPDHLDLLRIHSVVQAFIIDTLHEEKSLNFWLERATAIWCRSYDEADRRIHDNPRVGLPDDFRRFSIHGAKLLYHLERFEKRYAGLSAHARPEVQARLDKMQGQIEQLSRTIQAKIVSGSWKEHPASVFDRSSSMSETDSVVTPSDRHSEVGWDPFLASDGETPDPTHPPVFFDPTLPQTPTEWLVPYPTKMLMPSAPEVRDEEEETVVAPATWISSASFLHHKALSTSPSLDRGSQREYDDWHDGISHHRVTQRHNPRHPDRAGWRDMTISDPRVSVSQDLARGALSTRRMESRSPSRNRVTARSDAEMELNKIRKALPAPPTDPSAGSAPLSPTRPEYLLGRNSYSKVSARKAPDAELAVTPVPFTSGLAHIISSPKSWTAATVKRLKRNVLPSRSPVPPTSPVVSLHEDGAIVPPRPIFAGSRTASPSPARPASPSPFPAPLPRRDTHHRPPNLARLTSSSTSTSPLSFSHPTQTPPPPPTRTPYTAPSPPSPGASSPPPPRRRSLSPSSSPLALSPASSPDPRLLPSPPRHARPPSYTETEPSPGRGGEMSGRRRVG